MSTHQATVTEIQELAPAVIQLTISIHDKTFSFEPGQWVNFRFPVGVSRAYTIASAPQRPDAVQLCVRVGSGRGGAAVRMLRPGDAATVEGPHGDFLLPKGNSPVVLMAGDVGIAPVRSIVLHVLALRQQRKMIVLYEPDQRHILYAGDFDPLARDGAIIHESGRIETLIARNARILEGAVTMGAGFDGVLARGQSALRAKGTDTSGCSGASCGPGV